MCATGCCAGATTTGPTMGSTGPLCPAATEDAGGTIWGAAVGIKGAARFPTMSAGGATTSGCGGIGNVRRLLTIGWAGATTWGTSRGKLCDGRLEETGAAGIAVQAMMLGSGTSCVSRFGFG
jgi:hypothetical protein